MNGDPRQILLSFAGRIAHALVEELKGEAIESIFVSGSAARGDVAAFVGAEGIEIYSDLDLFVVVRGARDLEAIRRRARRAAAGVPRDGRGYRIIPEPDVGVFSEEDFSSQEARPGTVEIAETHEVLYGNGDAPRRAGRFVASAIDVTEGLYLIENRLCELAELAGRLENETSDGLRRYLHYAGLKSCLDGVSAALIAVGRFHPSRSERMKRLRDDASKNEISRFLPEKAMAYVERCYNGLVDLQKTLDRVPADDPLFHEEVSSVLLGVWKRVAREASSLESAGWNSLLDWRCKRGRWVGNSRELAVLARRVGVPRRRMLRRLATLASLSPVDALRVSGTVEALLRHRVCRGDETLDSGGIEIRFVPVIDVLTETLGFGDGPVFTRARRLHRETA